MQIQFCTCSAWAKCPSAAITDRAIVLISLIRTICPSTMALSSDRGIPNRASRSLRQCITSNPLVSRVNDQTQICLYQQLTGRLWPTGGRPHSATHSLRKDPHAASNTFPNTSKRPTHIDERDVNSTQPSSCTSSEVSRSTDHRTVPRSGDRKSLQAP